MAQALYYLIDVNHQSALLAMKNMAEAVVGKGVVFLQIQNKSETGGIVKYEVANGRLSRRPNPSELLVGGTGTNYFGVVMSKLAVMMDTQLPSGTFTGFVRNGEVSYRGGLIYVAKDHIIYTGCSGGPELVDVEIASLGMKKLGIN